MIKKILPDLIAILAFVLISFAYFFPADIEGRILFQHDTAAGAGAGQEAKEYYEQTGERTRWTNSLFGGMPTYQISPSYDSTVPLQWTQKIYQLFLPTYVNLTFILLLGFYILLRAFGIPAWLAGLGGIMWAFSSYFFILISAGHIWKFITLAYIPPTIAGIVLAYRGKLLAGGILTAFFIALQIMSNHVQMSYYFLFVILFIAGAYFEDAWRNKTLPRFFKASAVLLVAALIGVAANLSNLYHTYTYSKETMRGKSELVQTGDAAKQTSSGLDRDYITNWSYGIGETWTLLVPNFKGGSSSAPLSQSEAAMSMLFTINDSPFFGKEGKFVTSRHIQDRLTKELDKNLALRVRKSELEDGKWIVSGRGVLHLSVLIETMRREGYELQVGQPQVIFKEIDGVKCEPIEELTISVPEEYSSKMIDMVTRRKGDLVSMETQGDRVNIEFDMPSRGIIGLRTNVLTASAGEAIMAHRFKCYQPYKGEIERRSNGSMIAMESGTAFAYAIDKLQDRGKFFIYPQDEVYAGQVVGEHVHENDLVINVTKSKKLTNMRASGSDDKARIIPPVVFSLEEALEYIKEDEYVEVTPKAMRMRKVILDEIERKRANKN